jgi:ABC-type multidrug transport system fused ATPase/permease subunit
VLGLQVLLRRLRSHARARAQERGEITATVSERLGAIRLIRAFGEEEREASGFARQAERYRKRVIRTQRFSSLTSPLTEVFAGFLVILIIWAGTKPGLVGLATPLAPEAIIVFLMAALKLTSPLKTVASFPAAMAVTLAYLLVGSFWFQHWYVLWVLPLAAGQAAGGWLLFGALVPLQYLAGGADVPWAIRLAILLPAAAWMTRDALLRFKR